MSVELKVHLFIWSLNFRFSMSLSLSPNSLYRQTTDCTEGGGLTREHCIVFILQCRILCLCCNVVYCVYTAMSYIVFILKCHILCLYCNVIYCVYTAMLYIVFILQCRILCSYWNVIYCVYTVMSYIVFILRCRIFTKFFNLHTQKQIHLTFCLNFHLSVNSIFPVHST